MPRQPTLTYRGALQLLGQNDRPAILKLDQILGGILLGAGAASLAVPLSPALAPLAALSAAWAWISRKNEAFKLLRQILDSISKRLNKAGGYERYQLVSAAHTIIVAAAFFEALQEHLGAKEFAKLEITDDERRALTLGTSVNAANLRLIETIYEAKIPSPSAVRGFEETIPEIRSWMVTATTATQEFLSGLTAWATINRPLTIKLVDQAVRRYRSMYLRMAATVPEFLVWASLGEHAATRFSISDMREDLMALLADHTEALTRLEKLLDLTAPRIRAERDLCSIVNRANIGVLSEPTIPEAAIGSVERVIFPTIEEVFLNPNYRISAMSENSRPADDKWWEGQAVRTDLDVLMAAYVTTIDATEKPLLLLGHPGVGKSLLTKVIAARLPESSFTTVRVSLRRIQADAPVYQQIQEALDRTTNGRVAWWQLAEQSSSTLRVVLLDGLDELLQAAGHRGGYLQEVEEFQRHEAEQQRPVIVLVTSRTVVSDRVMIPSGTTMIKLEEFDDGQIEAWLAVWNHVNKDAISAGMVRGLSVQSALHQVELARQPLLLLMLALYAADPASADLESTLSSADLYRRILDDFSRREVSKTITDFRSKAFEEAVGKQLWRLSVAAFAMFNRGRQDVTDDELGTDLQALGASAAVATRTVDLGQKLIGQFFFIFVAEGRPFDSQVVKRSYEFLHATFGEYLISSYIIELLSEMAESTMSTRRGVHEPDDQLLYALLSHQTLATRKTTLTFAAQLMEEFSTDKQQQLLMLLDVLITGYRQRLNSGRYSGYGPIETDHVRELAAYSANLVLLRVMLDKEDTFTPVAVRADSETAQIWRSTVVLWNSGLDSDGFQSILSILMLDGDIVRPLRQEEIMPAEWADLLQARLIGDEEAESRLRFGLAVRDGALYSQPGDSWNEVNLSALIPAISLPDDNRPLLLRNFTAPGDNELRHAAVAGSVVGLNGYSSAALLQISSRLLIFRSRALSLRAVQGIITWMLSFPDEEYKNHTYVSYGFACAIAAYPELLDNIPQLRKADLYEVGALLIFDMHRDKYAVRLRHLSEKVYFKHFKVSKKDEYNAEQYAEMVQSILIGYGFEPPYTKDQPSKIFR